jgi:secreted PhoX family phosphatase
MARDFERMEDSNRSANRSIHEISDPSRRVVLLGGIGALTLGALAPWLAGRAVAAPAAGGRPLIGFKSVPVSEQDAVVVPEGYEAVAFAAWGEPIGVPGNIPAFRWDASNSAADQAVQIGMHHDGIHYFPIDGSSTHGLLVMNHEYTDDGLLFPDGKKHWTAEKVAKTQAAHGFGWIVGIGSVTWVKFPSPARVPETGTLSACFPQA